MNPDDLGQLDKLIDPNMLKQLQDKLQGGLGGLGGGIAGAGSSILSWLPWIAVPMAIYVAYRRGFGPTLVLDECRLRPGTDGDVVKFSGKQAGAARGLLGLFGADGATVWAANRNGVRFEVNGLFGRRIDFLGWRQIGRISYGYGVSAMGMLAAAFVILVGIAYFASLPGKLGVLVGVGLGVYALFNKRYSISASSAGGPPAVVAFRSAILGGESFDERKLREAGKLLESLMLAASPNPARDESVRSIPIPPPTGVAPEHIPLAFEPEPPPAPKKVSWTPPSPPVQSVQPTHEPKPLSVFVPQSQSAPRSLPVAPPAKRPAPAPEPAAVRPRPEREAVAKERKPRPPRPAATPADEAQANDAFTAGVRVFESGRLKQAEAAWIALIRRWPSTDAARRARKILQHRRANRPKS